MTFSIFSYIFVNFLLCISLRLCCQILVNSCIDVVWVCIFHFMREKIFFHWLLYCFPTTVVANYYLYSWQLNTINLFLYSSESQVSKISITGSKLRYWPGPTPFRDSRRVYTPWSFQQLLAPLGLQPYHSNLCLCVHLSSFPVCVKSPLHLSYKDTHDGTKGSSG